MDSFPFGTEDDGTLPNFRKQGQDCIQFRSACVSLNKCAIIPSPRTLTIKTTGARSVVLSHFGTEVTTSKSKSRRKLCSSFSVDSQEMEL